MSRVKSQRQDSEAQRRNAGRIWVNSLLILLAASVLLVVLFMLEPHTRRRVMALPDDILARVGDEMITVEEFTFRFETTPHVGKGRSVREDFLEALIIERFLAGKAVEVGLDTTARVQRLLRQVEEEAIVEGFLREMTARFTAVTEEELREHYQRMKRSLTLSAWVFADSLQAAGGAEAVRDKIPFEQASKPTLGPGVKYIQAQPLLWNQADRAFEDFAYGLKPGEVGGPFNHRGEWWLLRLISSETGDDPDIGSYADHQEYLKQTLTARKAREAQEALIAAVMTGRKLTVDPEGFPWLVNHLRSVLPSQATAGDVTPPLSFRQQENLFPDLVERQREMLDRPIVKLRGAVDSVWSGREVLEKLYAIPQPIHNMGEDRFENDVFQTLLWLAEFSTLAEKGREQGIDELDGVQSNIHIWSQHVRAIRGLGWILRDFGIIKPGGSILDLIENPTTPRQDSMVVDWINRKAVEGGLRIDRQLLHELDLVEIPAILHKRHFPNRPANPLPVGYPWALEWRPDKDREQPR